MRRSISFGFRSSSKYKYERRWILNLLKHGIKDSIDYNLCSKAYVFKTLMTFYHCSLCDEPTKVSVEYRLASHKHQSF